MKNNTVIFKAMADALRAEAERVEKTEGAVINLAIIADALDTCDFIAWTLNWAAHDSDNDADEDEARALYFEVERIMQQLRDIDDPTDWDALDFAGYLAHDLIYSLVYDLARYLD